MQEYFKKFMESGLKQVYLGTKIVFKVCIFIIHIFHDCFGDCSDINTHTHTHTHVHTHICLVEK